MTLFLALKLFVVRMGLVEANKEEDLDRVVEHSDVLFAASWTSTDSLSQLSQLFEKYAESLAEGKFFSNSSSSEFEEVDCRFCRFKVRRTEFVTF